MSRSGGLAWTVAGLLCVAGGAPALRAGAAGTIETDFLQQPWPHQRVRVLKVCRTALRWRQRAGRTDGIFAGVQFIAPLAHQRAWDLANDYTDIGRGTPGVTGVRFLERSPSRQVIQVDVKVLWKRLRLVFEVEQEPPQIIRFRLVNEAIGEYRGVCTFAEPPRAEAGRERRAETSIELSTWFNPSRPVPAGLLLFAERMTLLQGVKEFLKTCDAQGSKSAGGST